MFAVDHKPASMHVLRCCHKERTEENAWRETGEGAYICLHGTEISGTLMVSVVIRQVRCCEPVTVMI